MKVNIIVSACIIFFMVGCSEARIDGSSEAAFEKSLETIADSMSKEDAEEFYKSVAIITVAGMGGRKMIRGEVDELVDFDVSARKNTDGMTAKQIIAEAERILENSKDNIGGML